MSNSAPNYPAIRTISTFGPVIAIVLGLAPIAAAMGMISLGFSWLWTFPALVTGGLLYLLVQSYVEVLRILADTLMPR
jgi:hypothetical protein